MASLTQSSWISYLQTAKPKQHYTHPTFVFHINPKISQFKTLKFSSFALGRSNDDESSTPESSEILDEPKLDRIKLAFERAREYKKSFNVDETQEPSSDAVGKVAELVTGRGGPVPGDEDAGPKEGPEASRIKMEEATEYQQNGGLLGSGRSNVENENSPVDGDARKEVPEALRIAMEKAEEYKKSKEKLSTGKSNLDNKQLPGDVDVEKEEAPEVLRVARERAKEYKKNKGLIENSSGSQESLKMTGLKGGSASNFGNESVERKIGRKEALKVSSSDFIGLDFADKKSRGLPAGLVPVADSFPEDDLLEVEILVGDASKFGNVASSETKTSSEGDMSDVYKPKVSTWGMFPRPSNISKTFGGGRNIRPGEALETPEDRAAKEARTRQLLAAYKGKIGLNMDPKLKADCEKALKDGDSLMDMGRLKEALPYYQKVMDKLSFQTELHGLAALQWSICQDSLSRPEKARMMYEKLQSHPNAQVSKKARQFMFSFQAMEMMKVTRSTVSLRNTGYQNYFDAFIEDKANYSSGSTEAEDNALSQALPYIVFLASPILLVLLVAASKGI